MTHRAETKLVKSALQQAGIPVSHVGHDRGTAYCWLNITLERGPHPHEHGDAFCPLDCKALLWTRESRLRALVIAQQVTGRRGDHDGEIAVHFR